MLIPFQISTATAKLAMMSRMSPMWQSSLPTPEEMSNASVVNPFLTPHVFHSKVKDKRWLTLEVCREFMNKKCSRCEEECKFAHPPTSVEIENGRVTCCYDFVKVCFPLSPPSKL